MRAVAAGLCMRSRARTSSVPSTAQQYHTGHTEHAQVVVCYSLRQYAMMTLLLHSCWALAVLVKRRCGPIT